MKMKELLLDAIINTRLFEMAHELANARNKVTGLQDVFAENLIKTLIFDKSQNLNHWRGKIDGFLKQLARIRIKPDNRQLSYDDLFDRLFDEPLGHTDATTRIMNDLVADYPNEILTNSDPDMVNKELLHIFQKICSDLSKGICKSINTYYEDY